MLRRRRRDEGHYAEPHLATAIEYAELISWPSCQIQQD